MGEIQLVDSDGGFVGGLNVEQAGNSSDYGVLAVIGCQSSGKSTMLNNLFGTRFPVLDSARHGRRRTTVGVWSAIAETDQPIVLLDVEGSDSRERGEGKHSFESRTALLAMALSDVIVVNMWMHDIGRHQAANYDLLEIVFSQSMQAGVRQPGKKKRIVVAIRDYEAETAEVSELEAVLLSDLSRIWSSSVGATGPALPEVFELDFRVFPHFKYNREAFTKEIDAFRDDLKNFTSKSILLGSFEEFARGVWTSIEENLSGSGWALDLPGHVEMVLRAECDQAKDAAMKSVEKDLLDLRFSVEVAHMEPLSDFMERVSKLREKALHDYDGRVGLHRDSGVVYDLKRNELKALLLSRAKDDRTLVFNTAKDKALRNLETYMKGVASGSAEFDRNVKRCRDMQLSEFHVTVTMCGMEGDNIDQLAESMCAVLQSRMDDLVRERKQVDEIVWGPEPVHIPWWRNRRFWKDMAIRGAILAFNYWQATRQLNAMRAGNIKRDQHLPTGPTF